MDPITNFWITGGIVLLLLVQFVLARSMYRLGHRAGRATAFVDATGWILDRDQQRRDAKVADLVRRQPAAAKGPQARPAEPYL